MKKIQSMSRRLYVRVGVIASLAARQGSSYDAVWAARLSVRLGA